MAKRSRSSDIDDGVVDNARDQSNGEIKQLDDSKNSSKSPSNVGDDDDEDQEEEEEDQDDEEEEIDEDEEEIDEEDDEDEEEIDEEDDEDEEDKDIHKPKRQKLSAQDVQIARETAELFKSNIFKLEIDELIKELKLKDSHCKLIEKVLHKLYNIIQQIPDSEELSLTEAERYFRNSEIKIPFPDPKPSNLNYKFQYSSPDNVSLVGSFGLKTGIQQRNGMSIDVCLSMPKNLIQPKDYLNYRILYKKSFYLSYLAENLSKLAFENNLPIKISYDYHNGDKLAPSLLIESIVPEEINKNDLIFNKTNFKIRLLVGLPFGVFENKKLLPDKNCIRIQSYDNSTKLPPTPLYNSSVLSSCTYNYYLKYLYTIKKSTEAFRDAAALGKLWLNQKGFSSNINRGGFGHFEFVILMSALLEGGGINGNRILLHGFSSYQLFKGTIRYLSTQDICNDGYLSFTSLIGENKSIYKKGGFNVPTVFDKNSKINILWKMNQSSYQMLKKFSTETLELLNDVVQDRFRQIFILNNNNLHLKYDLLVSIPLKSIKNIEDFGPLEKIQFLTFENFIISKIYKILHRALHERVLEIDINLSSNFPSWSITKRKPPSDDNQFINIGLYLNPLESEKKVTKGPLHSDKIEGEKFLSFWGNKAQVRRYKDGNIQYSCLWENSNANESIIISIVKYILGRHLQENIENELVTNSTKYTNLLPKSVIPFSKNSQPLILPNHYQDLKNSFNAVCKLISNIELPLTVRSILPISSSLRNTSLLLPVPFATSNPDFFNESILQFETSFKWPDELIALEKTKTAFLLKIQSYLSENTSYTSFITKDEDSIPYNKNITCLNVLSPDGYGFKFRILTEKDETLYLRAIEACETKQKSTVTEIYIKFMQKYIGSVKHHRAINTLVTHFPFYSATVRLFKKWLDSQLLLSHFNEELIELMVLKIFIDPYPYSVPSSVQSGFLRVLNFLSSWNWKEDPIILDLSREFSGDYKNKDSYVNKINDNLTLSSYQMMYNNFTKLRNDDPNALKIQFFIASKEDPSGKLWSTNISLVIATRLTALSKIVINLLNSRSSLSVDDNFLKLIFTPAIKDYDFVIRLNNNNSKDLKKLSGLLPNDIKFKNLVEPLKTFGNFDDSVDSAINYFRELKGRFSNIVILSIGKFGGLVDGDRVITGLIIPGKNEKKFRVGLGYSFKPIDGKENMVSLDLDDVLKSCDLLGCEMVKGIERKK